MRKKDLPFKIITHPRSGLNLFRSLLKQHGYVSSASHSMTKPWNNLDIITIARRPEESASSWFAMSNFYNKAHASQDIESYLKEYTVYYRWFFDNVSYVVLYDNLIQSPKATVEEAFNHFSIPYEDIDYDLTLEQDDPSKGYLRTSVGVSSYNKAKTEALASKSLSEAQEAYEKLLSKFRGQL